MRVFELKQKEIINSCTCKSMGCPVDVEFDCKTGQITQLIVPGPGRFLGFFGRDCEFFIPWCDIVKIGPDIILVDVKDDEIRHKL